MTYNLFTTDRLQPPRVSDALASCLRVEPNSVDVADVDADQDIRNWDALALCDYSDVLGDVSLTLDIFVQDAVSQQPPESEFASRFAVAAQTVVLYPAEEHLPSAYWLVTPTGLVTRARLLASDDERPEYSIDAVEAAVPQLPGIRVMQLPEIVREQHVPTPTTSEFVHATELLRKAQETPANPALADESESHLYHSRAYLAEWERMVRRMESDWHPTGKYPVELYCEALLARDRIEQLPEELSRPVADLLRQSVGQLDEAFKKCTAPDDTWAAEAEVPGSPADLGGRGWWWHRKPLTLPWDKN
ncbi:hypothetical protein ACGFN1_10360 [Streptomyces sp. NPDC048685]|uniref:hypothetical protein n=1 Tax=Streptomyces sp. NPDC048685 TaxID=3365584 RepID=UPI003721750D